MNGEYLRHHELLVDATADTHVSEELCNARADRVSYWSWRAEIRDKESEREMK